MHARPQVFLGLGSNLGDREANLERALRALEARGVRIDTRSSLYLTEPVGGPPQQWFVNMVARAETALAPEPLLAACLELELGMGRTRELRNGPRVIDVDILFYGDLVRDQPGLRLPHPRLHQRRFVLVPLVEIAPALLHPALGLTAAELLARCDDASDVRRLQPQGARG